MIQMGSLCDLALIDIDCIYRGSFEGDGKNARLMHKTHTYKDIYAIKHNKLIIHIWSQSLTWFNLFLRSIGSLKRYVNLMLTHFGYVKVILC